MNLFQAAKRISLFIVVNLLVVATLSIVLSLILHLLGPRVRMQEGSLQMLMLFCLVWGMGGAFLSLAMSRLMAKWFMGVKIINPASNDRAQRELVQMVHTLAQRAGLTTMPQVGYYESDDVNAFATGPTKSRSLVAVSTGLLQRMGRGEVEGVLAHEVAHIANGDMVTMTLIQGVINAIAMFLARILAFAVSNAIRSRDDRGSYWLQFILVQVFQVILSLLGAIVVCWFSRWREFRADAGGAAYSSRTNMVGALRALQRMHETPATAEAAGPASFQALKISGRPSGFLRLFSTHPPLEERIARLESNH